MSKTLLIVKKEIKKLEDKEGIFFWHKMQSFKAELRNQIVFQIGPYMEIPFHYLSGSD